MIGADFGRRQIPDLAASAPCACEECETSYAHPPAIGRIGSIYASGWRPRKTSSHLPLSCSYSARLLMFQVGTDGHIHEKCIRTWSLTKIPLTWSVLCNFGTRKKYHKLIFVSCVQWHSTQIIGNVCWVIQVSLIKRQIWPCLQNCMKNQMDFLIDLQRPLGNHHWPFWLVSVLQLSPDHSEPISNSRFWDHSVIWWASTKPKRKQTQLHKSHSCQMSPPCTYTCRSRRNTLPDVA